jgi:hypothetical protein
MIGRADALALLIEEVKTLQYLGLFTECWRRSFTRQAPQMRHDPAGAAAVR